MKQKVASLLVVPVLAVGCGGGDSPTTPAPRVTTIETTSESTIAAHTASCVGFRQDASGEASASANLSTGLPVPIEIGAGSCVGTRSVIARGDGGAVTATLAVGDSFVRFENTSDRDASYRLTLRRLALY